MKRKILCTLAVLTACLALASCKKGGTEVTSSSATAVETPAPTPTLPPYEANVLTGEPKGEDYPEGQRITSVMVNNIVAARPQRGLSKAQMLFEIKVEGGITRFMAVYNDYNDIPEIGPIRSGRDQFFRLMLPWQALYIHEGQSIVMQQYAIDYDYGLLNNNDGANGYRDYNRVNWAGATYNNGTLAKEHTMYTSGENIAKYISDNNVDMNRTYNSTFFNFVDYRQENPVRDLTNSQDSAQTTKYGDVVTDGEYVEITHSQSYKTRFIYDSTSQTYKMQQNYSDGQWRNTVDEGADNVQLEFPNVITLYTGIYAYPGHEAKDLQYAEYSWGGIGYYSYGGKTERIYWQKEESSPQEALRLYYLDENGQCSDTPCEINIGKSYVTFVDDDEAVNYVTKSLDGVDLSAYGVAASDTHVEEDNAQEGETLGMTTNDLTTAAKNGTDNKSGTSADGGSKASSTASSTTGSTQQSEPTQAPQQSESQPEATQEPPAAPTEAPAATEAPADAPAADGGIQIS